MNFFNFFYIKKFTMNFEHGIEILERPKQIVWKSSFLHKNSRHESLISEHAFNHSMQLMLPYENSDQKKQLKSIINKHIISPGKSTFYYVIRINEKNVESFIDLIVEALSKDYIVRSLAVNGLVDPIKIAVSDNCWLMHINEKMTKRFGIPCSKIKSFLNREVWRVDVTLHGDDSIHAQEDQNQDKEMTEVDQNSRKRKRNYNNEQNRKKFQKVDSSENNNDSDISNPNLNANDIIINENINERSPTSWGLIPRLKWAMKRWVSEEKLQIDFILSIENKNGDSTDMKLFTSHQFPCKKIDGFGKSLELPLPKKLILPKVRSYLLDMNTQKEKWDSILKSILNYVGVVSTGSHNYLRTNNSDNKYDDAFIIHSLYGSFEEDDFFQCKGGIYLNISGLISPSIISKTIQELKKFYSGLNEQLWYSVLVTGFENSPISWRKYNHSPCIGSENDYVFINLAGKDECYISVQCLNEYGVEVY